MSALYERLVDMDARMRRKCQGLYWTPTAFPAGHDRVSCIHPSFGRHPTGVGYLGKTKNPNDFCRRDFFVLLNSQ